MANLPANNDMTGSAVTQGGFRARLNDVLDFLRGTIGSTGTPAAARSALGLGALATRSDVAAQDIATGAVTADKIGTDAVTAAKIAAGAVTGAKIADGAVSTGKVAAGAITDGLLAANSVTTGKVADAAVTAAKIANGAVTGAKLAAGAVGTAAIADGTVTPAKLAAGALSVSVVAEADITSPVAQLDLSLPAGWSMFLLLVGDLRPAQPFNVLCLRTSIDGVTFASGVNDYYEDTGFSSLARIGPYGTVADDRSFVAQHIIWPGAASTGRFSVGGHSFYMAALDPAPAPSPVASGRTAVGRQQAIRLFMGGGNINRGTFRLLGVA